MTQNAESAVTADHLASRLCELWSAERCDWTLNFDEPRYGNKGCWTLSLEWTQEYDNPHGADWSTHTWEFSALVGEGGPEAVLRDAVEWCEALEQSGGRPSDV